MLSRLALRNGKCQCSIFLVVAFLQIIPRREERIRSISETTNEFGWHFYYVMAFRNTFIFFHYISQKLIHILQILIIHHVYIIMWHIWTYFFALKSKILIFFMGNFVYVTLPHFFLWKDIEICSIQYFVFVVLSYSIFLFYVFYFYVNMPHKNLIYFKCTKYNCLWVEWVYCLR